MLQVNLEELKELLPHYHTNKMPLYLWGKPSSGKTSIIRQFAQQKAKELGLEYSEDEYGPKIFTMKVITMSQFDAPDLRGMPELIKKGDQKFTEFCPTKELPREGQGIIFFDEMNLADDITRAAMYSYVLEGRISNLPPVPGFWRVAASNSEKDYSNVNSTSLALLSRFAHIEVEPDVMEIIQYFFDKEGDSRILSYLKNFPEDLFPKKWDEKLLDAKANPFPRQWESASILIKGVEKIPLIGKLVGSCVGSEVASKFTAHCKLIDRVNIDRLLKSPKVEIEKFNSDPERASLLYAICFSLSSLWQKADKRLTPVKVLEIAKTLPPEFAVSFLKLVIRKRINKLNQLPEWDKVIDDLGIYFD
jgi:hypothetical protein